MPRLLPLVALPGLLAALLLPAIAGAATLRVVVTGADGLPVANAVVQATPATPVAPRAASGPVVIVQKDVRFVPVVTAVPVGTTVRFTNQDRFDHHVRSQPGGPLGTLPPATDFELRLAGAKGDKVSTADVHLDTPGTILLGCHLHSTMRGHLYVSRTPFVAVTDAAGVATLEGLPDGEAVVRAWHPEQLADQADLRMALTPRGETLALRLNFTPPRRRGVSRLAP